MKKPKDAVYVDLETRAALKRKKHRSQLIFLSVFLILVGGIAGFFLHDPIVYGLDILHHAAVLATATQSPVIGTSEQSLANTVGNDKPVYRLSSINLFKEYSENAAAADAKYKGKLIAVTGKIVQINQSGEEVKITLSVDDLNMLCVCCKFDAQSDELLALKASQTAMIKGVCEGKAIEGVVLSGCVLI